MARAKFEEGNDNDKGKSRLDLTLDDAERHRLEQQTIRNERKSKKITERFGIPKIERMSDAEIELENKLRKMFTNRNYQPCASCGGSKGNPTTKAIYQLDGCVKVERYCSVCVTKLG